MSKEEGKKKGSALKIILIVVGVLVAIIILAALFSGGDEDSEYSDDYTSESYSSDDSSQSSSSSSSSIDLSSEDEYPLGTCRELEGRTVIMSIAANDATTGWDFDNEKDAQTLTSISEKFYKGLEWIVAEGKKYGKDIEFVYNWDEDNELFYTADLSEDYSHNESNLQDQKVFIDENLSSYAKKLVEKYNADNILFVYYFNMPENTDFICFATPFQGTELGMDLPYETVCIDKWVYGAEQGPATYAHEVLHAFGAPDLNKVDMDGSNYGLTQDFVDYCGQNYINEIMYSTYDPYNMVIPLDKVTNELTDITAYFIGWIDSSEECEAYGVANSAH